MMVEVLAVLVFASLVVQWILLKPIRSFYHEILRKLDALQVNAQDQTNAMYPAFSADDVRRFRGFREAALARFETFSHEPDDGSGEIRSAREQVVSLDVTLANKHLEYAVAANQQVLTASLTINEARERYMKSMMPWFEALDSARAHLRAVESEMRAETDSRSGAAA
jgi:hypothetical protein